MNQLSDIMGQWNELEDSPRKTDDYQHREFKLTTNGNARLHWITVNGKWFRLQLPTEVERDFMVSTYAADAPEEAHTNERRWRIEVTRNGKLKTAAFVDMWDGTLTTHPAAPAELKTALEVATGKEVID